VSESEWVLVLVLVSEWALELELALAKPALA